VGVVPGLRRCTRDRLSTAAAGSDRIDAVAVGSPHFSPQEFRALVELSQGHRFRVPFYACTGRGVLAELERADLLAPLKASGVEIVVDTCVVVAPILPPEAGVLMTNSGKFAFYAPANTGFATVYGSLADCVVSAVAGRVTRDERLWS
jgi:predicted aconitase